MRFLAQRVKEAQVVVDEKVVGSIGRGLCVFLGIHKEDTPSQTEWLVNKLVNMRIFPDEKGRMNLRVKEIQGEILIVSQFTLYGNCREGRRPHFIASASAQEAEPIYEKFVEETRQEMGRVQTGIFGAKMGVELVNEGPVTLLLDDRMAL